MRTRIFLWGLSNGIIALTVAALFWIGLGLGPYAGRVEWYVDALVSLLVYGFCGASIWAATRIRRRSGFRREDLRPADPDQRAANHRTALGFVRIVVAQTVLVGLTVIVCLLWDARELLWPSIGVIVSLHFIPLGGIFRVRPYYFVGVAGSVVSLSSFAAAFGTYRMMYLGVAMGIMMIGSATYLIRNAEDLARKAVREVEVA